jgi:NMD protein affecting ribosome stability and mRNA decay
MFCVKCGKEASIKYLCEKCFLNGKDLFKIEDFELVVCPLCNKGGNVDEELDKRIEVEGKINDLKTVKRDKGGATQITITAKGTIPPAKSVKKDEKIIKIRIRNRQCANCSMISGNYHEAIIQVRGPDRDAIFKKAEKMLPKTHITNIESRKEGYDLKIVKKGEAAKVANTLRKKYNVITSYKLASEKKGKKLYRNIYSIR